MQANVIVDDGLITTRIQTFELHPELRAGRTTDLVLPLPATVEAPMVAASDASDNDAAATDDDMSELESLCEDPELTMQLRAAHQGRKLILASLAASVLALAGAISLVLL